jgi:hypothetical protein
MRDGHRPIAPFCFFGTPSDQVYDAYYRIGQFLFVSGALLKVLGQRAMGASYYCELI